MDARESSSQKECAEDANEFSTKRTSSVCSRCDAFLICKAYGEKGFSFRCTKCNRIVYENVINGQFFNIVVPRACPRYPVMRIYGECMLCRGEENVLQEEA